MRLILLLLLLPALASALTLEVTHYLNVTTSTSCPGDLLHVSAMGSDGNPGVGVELRLALIEPYAGLRAVMHTDAGGSASVQLTRTGQYRLRIYTDDYNHEEYVEFNYSSMCPPPPPKQMELTATPDCAAGALMLNVTSGGAPLQDVLVRTGNWSSLTGPGGIVSFPLEEGLVYIRTEKAGYAGIELYQNVSCALPPLPGCVINEECAQGERCASGNCTNVTGACGYAANHSWINYECCSDSDCGNASICENNACVVVPVPSPAANTTNETVIPQESKQAEGSPLDNLLLCGAGVAITALVVFLLTKKK